MPIKCQIASQKDVNNLNDEFQLQSIVLRLAILKLNVVQHHDLIKGPIQVNLDLLLF